MPVEVQTPAGVVTEVSFGGVRGTELVSAPDGTWSVVTPPHDPGPVDVVVSWTMNGVAQTPITTPNGFTYMAPVAPTITNPAAQTVIDGTTATFTVTATGYPAPAVAWEVSPDDGATWEDAATNTAVTVSADGREASITATLEYDGYQFRATATNYEGTVVSEPAVLTVTEEAGTDPETPGTTPPGTDDETPGTTPPSTDSGTPKVDTGNGTAKVTPDTAKADTGLARTGGNDMSLIWWAAAVMLVLGAALVTRRSRGNVIKEDHTP